ncbi:MAG: orotidine-5'-phosphate decarboxylase [Candidatus Xenobia bacterium]
MIIHPRDPLIVALDVPTLEQALALVDQLKDSVGMFKVGLQLFCSVGPQGVRELSERGIQMFLDLKLHDIPNTVVGALRSVDLPGVAMISVHALGGPAMLKAASQACPLGKKLLAITMLTSMDEQAAQEVGISRRLEEQVVALGRMAVASGVDGIVASPNEVAALRSTLGKTPVIVTPGIRTIADAANDQARTGDPVSALRSGADYLVVGRPITAQPDPAHAAREMVNTMQRAFTS